MVTLVQVKNNLLAPCQLCANPGHTLSHLLLRSDGEDLHVLLPKLYTLVLISGTVPGREKGVYAGGLTNRVTHGNVLDHLTLATLDRGTQDDTAALVIFQERKNVRAYEVGEVGALKLKGCYWPRLWCDHF